MVEQECYREEKELVFPLLHNIALTAQKRFAISLSVIILANMDRVPGITLGLECAQNRLLMDVCTSL